MPSKPKPMAQGTLAKTPLTHVLVHMLAHNLHGTLEISAGPHRWQVYARDGQPAKVVTSRPSKRLGEILTEIGKLTADQLRQSVAEAKKTGDLQGQAMVRLGFVDTETLVAGITDQMTMRLLDAFIIRDGQFAFYQGVNLIAEAGELVSMDTFALLARAVRFHGAKMATEMNPAFSTLRSKAFYLANEAPLERFRFTPAERRICRLLLERPYTLELLKNLKDVDLGLVKVVLYVLFLCHQLKVIPIEQAAHVAATMPPPKLDFIPAPPEKSSYPPDIQKLRDEIQQRATSLPAQNYYEMLGVDKAVDDNGVRTAFFRLAKKFHPDRSSKKGLEDLKDTLAYLFANLSEAQTTLLDIDARAAYDQSLEKTAQPSKNNQVTPGLSAEEEEVRKVLEAENLHQKSMVLLRQQKYQAAYDMNKKALDHCPKESEYVALDAYLRLMLNRSSAERLIETMRAVSKENPHSERIHFYFGHILKKANHLAEAKSQFQKVVAINALNIEAAREIRLIDIMSRHSGSFKKPSFFSRLKK